MNLNNVFKASQVAEHLNIHEQTVRRRAKALGIEMIKLGSAYVFTADDVKLIAAYCDPEPQTPASEGLLTSKQAAAQVSPTMSASSFVRRAREIGVYPLIILERTKEKAYWTQAQVDRLKVEYTPFVNVQKSKPKQKGVAPFAPMPVKVMAGREEQYTTTPITVVTDGREVTARYLRLIDAPKPFNVCSWG